MISARLGQLLPTLRGASKKTMDGSKWQMC